MASVATKISDVLSSTPTVCGEWLVFEKRENLPLLCGHIIIVTEKPLMTEDKQLIKEILYNNVPFSFKYWLTFIRKKQ